jgi:hypothetical protein
VHVPVEYIYYRLFRIASMQTVTLLDEGRPMDLDHDPEFNLELKPRVFTIEFGEPWSGASVIVSHVIEQNKTHRVDPVAPTARDFVFEWLNRPWNEMVPRSSPAALAHLKQSHSRLHGKLFLPIVDAGLCRDRRWQVAVMSDGIPNRQFFQVEERPQQRFIMLDVREHAFPTCPALH